MKPQNYSLKFQNNLAESRIIPGSQHLISRSNAAVPNGQRAARKPTKAQLRRGGISKNTTGKAVHSPDSSNVTPLVQLLSRRKREQAEARAKLERREAEKRREAKKEGSIKGILKNTKVNPGERKEVRKGLEEEG